MTELVRLYREVGGSPRENPRRGSSEIESLRQQIENLDVVSAQELHQLTASEFWCQECGARISDVAQKQCGRCGSEVASRSPKYVCSSCKNGVDPQADVRCLCGSNQAILALELEADSQPSGEFACQRCGAAVDVNWGSCRECGHDKAIRRADVR